MKVQMQQDGNGVVIDYVPTIRGELDQWQAHRLLAGLRFLLDEQIRFLDWGDCLKCGAEIPNPDSTVCPKCGGTLAPVKS